MSQRGHDPHGYNPHELSTPLPQGQSSLLCQQDHSDLLINANTQGTISICMFKRKPITLH